jgi:hypothetical protein
VPEVKPSKFALEKLCAPEGLGFLTMSSRMCGILSASKSLRSHDKNASTWKFTNVTTTNTMPLPCDKNAAR